MMNEPELFAAAESLAEAMVQRGMNTPDVRVMATSSGNARVADCIDKGRAAGLDDAYIAPLVVVKAAMAKNLLAAPVAS